jgi:hypothetical protein
VDDKARKKLVDKLAVAGSFDREYADFDRRWCVDMLIRVFGTRGVADSAIEATVKTLLASAKTVVTAKRDFKSGVNLDKKRAATERAWRGRRVEILYGLIAAEPKLADAANADYLDFIARRRYRTIERMALFVNPNGRGYFRYPDTCSTNFSGGRWHWKINVTAQTYWEPLTATADVPIWMKNPPTAPAAFDPVKAIGSLFTQKDDPCKGNLLDCATTLNVVLMDSLLEAKDPNAFAGTLAAKGALYLSIVHVNPPIGPHPEGFFLIDNTAEGLFVKGGAALDDLQVGDHVYIRNHQLYKTLRPTGSWSGEHALVTDCGNRQIDSDKGYRFMGHGMPHGGETGAIPRFYKGLLNEINTYLHRSFRLAAIFLNYLQTNKAQPPPAQVQHQAKSVTDPNGVTFTVDFYFFDVSFSYNDFDSKPAKGTKLATRSEHGFVVAHAPSQNQFFLHHRKTIADAITDGVFSRRAGILFQPDPAADPSLDPNDPVRWNLIYVDTDDTTELNYTLFERQGSHKTLSMVQLDMSELYTEPLGRVAPGSSDVFTTRPRVSLDPAYITFLRTSKALPP